jgi:hypothetical protein
MKSLSGLERRITVLERPTADIDLLEIAINKLNDSELGLIEEYMSLLNAGFLLDEVSDMMGTESYSQALGIVNKIDQELQRLTAPPVRQSIASASKRRKRVLEVDHGIED